MLFDLFPHLISLTDMLPIQGETCYVFGYLVISNKQNSISYNKEEHYSKDGYHYFFANFKQKQDGLC